MTECSAFNLKENLTVETLPAEETNDLFYVNDNFVASTLDDNIDFTNLNEIFINLNFVQTNVAADYPTPPVSADDTGLKSKEEHGEEIMFYKPKRPYSYYIATNFHPLDLSLVNEKINELENMNEMPVANANNNNQSDAKLTPKKVKRRSKNKETCNNKSKRLSASLGDITGDLIIASATANNHQTTQNTPLLAKKKTRSLSKDRDFELVDEFNSGSNHFLARRQQTISTSEMNSKMKSTTKSSNQYSSTKRLNKFLRNIFKIQDNLNSAADLSDEPVAVNSEPLTSMPPPPLPPPPPPPPHPSLPPVSFTALTTHEEDISNNNNKFKSKFTRFFSSFRSTSTESMKRDKKKQPVIASKYIEKSAQPFESTNLKVSDDKLSVASRLLMLPEIKLAVSVDHLNEHERKLANQLTYNEIEMYLKNLSTSKLSSNSETTGYESGYMDSLSKPATNKSTSAMSSPLSSPQSGISSSFASLLHLKSSSCLDSHDIPFIDEDLESNYDLNLNVLKEAEPINQSHDAIKSTLTSVSSSSCDANSSRCSCLLNMINNCVIQEYLRDVSFLKLDSIMCDYFKSTQIEWIHVVLVYDITNRAIKMLNEINDKCLINELKEICAKYINSKYSEFISQNGGWVKMKFANIN